ncbi:MAG: hypothetical protein JWN94_4269 [Betaproteobacteria bacterium]|nr:hypothetical protein [Betaproteobacteria bacterium]
MDGFAAFCFGIWFGLTGPLALHVSIVLLSQHARHANASRQEIVFIRVVRFIGTPLLMLGILGVASVFGFTREHANLGAIGMFVGLAAYGLLFYLYRKMSRGETPKLLSDREIWLNHWEMARAAGRKTFLLQHTLMGCLIGFFASLILYLVRPHVGGANIGEFPWILGVFAFFPLVIALYARWTWNVSEKQFYALRGDSST